MKILYLFLGMIVFLVTGYGLMLYYFRKLYKRKDFKYWDIDSILVIGLCTFAMTGSFIIKLLAISILGFSWSIGHYEMLGFLPVLYVANYISKRLKKKYAPVDIEQTDP